MIGIIEKNKETRTEFNHRSWRQGKLYRQGVLLTCLFLCPELQGCKIFGENSTVEQEKSKNLVMTSQETNSGSSIISDKSQVSESDLTDASQERSAEYQVTDSVSLKPSRGEQEIFAPAIPINSSELPVKVSGLGKVSEKPMIFDQGSNITPGNKHLQTEGTIQPEARQGVGEKASPDANDTNRLTQIKNENPAEASVESEDKSSHNPEYSAVRQTVLDALRISSEDQPNLKNKEMAIAALDTMIKSSDGSDKVSETSTKLPDTGNKIHLDFYHLSQGGYRKEIQRASELIVMDSHESVMDFLKFVELPKTQVNFSDWLKFDFQKELVLAFLVRNPAKGTFIQLRSLSLDGLNKDVLTAEYESYQEDSSCSFTQWVSSEVSFHLVRIPRQIGLSAGSHQVRSTGSTIKGCHGLLANFSQSDSAKSLSVDVVWRGNVERPQNKVTLFQKNWEAWNDFTALYCLDCKSIETKNGFPDQQIAILVSEPGLGQLHLRKAFRNAGLLFLDLERDDCKEQKNSILLLLRKKDLDLSDGALDQSKIALAGPWIPKTKRCGH